MTSKMMKAILWDGRKYPEGLSFTEYPQMNTQTLEAIDLTSISGITVATLIIVELIKRLVGNAKWIKKIPIFVYVLFVSVLLTIFANKGLKTSDNQPLLKGDTISLVWQAIVSAAGSSGFYTWLRNPHKSPHTFKQKQKQNTLNADKNNITENSQNTKGKI